MDKVIITMEDGIITGEQYPEHIQLEIRDYGEVPNGAELFKDDDGKEYFLR